MIAYSYIERNLDSLDKRYRQARSNQDAMYFSKIAMLELCGWLEISIDDCILRCARRILKNPSSLHVINEKIRGTYGFEYERHFRSLIMSLVGIYGFERVERRIDPSIVANFKSELGALKTSRNTLAHTYTRGITASYDAPSVVQNRYSKVKSGLSEYDRVLRLLY